MPVSQSVKASFSASARVGFGSGWASRQASTAAFRAGETRVARVSGAVAGVCFMLLVVAGTADRRNNLGSVAAGQGYRSRP